MTRSAQRHELDSSPIGDGSSTPCSPAIVAEDARKMVGRSALRAITLSRGPARHNRRSIAFSCRGPSRRLVALCADDRRARLARIATWPLSSYSCNRPCRIPVGYRGDSLVEPRQRGQSSERARDPLRPPRRQRRARFAARVGVNRLRGGGRGDGRQGARLGAGLDEGPDDESRPDAVDDSRRAAGGLSPPS